MDNLEAIAGRPGQLTVGPRVFTIAPPTPGDMLREMLQMRQLARATCLSPIDYAARHAHLPPSVFAVVMREAVALGASSGGKTEPTDQVFQEQYALPEGVRWRLHYHVSRSGYKDFTEADAKALVTDHNCIDLCNALDAALKLATLDAEKKTLPTGSTGSPPATGPTPSETSPATVG